MRCAHLLLSALLVAPAACGDKDKPADDDAARAAVKAGGARGEALVKQADEADAEAKTLTPEASCMGVLATQRITEITADLKMTRDGEPYAVALDPSKIHDKNQIWDAGAAPAACGLVSNRAPAGLIFVGQFTVDGAPVMRLQIGGTKPGTHELRGTMALAGMLAQEGQERPLGMMFKKGSMTVSPDPFVAGPFEIKIEGAEGEAVFGLDVKVPFTLEGTIKGAVASREQL